MTSLSRVRLFVTPWTVAYQAPRSRDFPGKNTGAGCYFLLHLLGSLKVKVWDFPGGPVFKTLPLQRVWVQSLVKELGILHAPPHKK